MEPYSRYGYFFTGETLASHDREVAARSWEEGFKHANSLHDDLGLERHTVPMINPYKENHS
jgi:hypothetical protein